MRIPLIEQISPRYIHINPATNKVHLMVPVVGGQEISTDNTCRARQALRDFFDGGALQALNAYKETLVFDIALLAESDVRRSKQERLVQIEVYIRTVAAMEYRYGGAIIALLERPSNLYSVQLRPCDQDHASSVVNPVFTVRRTNAPDGTPLSTLYNAMHAVYPAMVVAAAGPRTRLTTAALAALPASSFEDIQRVLGEQSVALFGLTIDFSRQTNGMPVTKEYIDAIMGADATPEDYMNALLGACALDVWTTLPTSPFYSIPAEMSVAERTEKFSIITQFFLANLNVYCKAKDISTQNFGEILDANYDLSNRLVTVVSTALTHGADVEQAIYNFFNAHQIVFHLSRPLNEGDLTAIRQKFELTYRTVTATRENPHMDDFMFLDKEATGETAKFVTHQGSICVNLADIDDPLATFRDKDYFASVRADFAVHAVEIPHRNESVAGDIEIDVETLLTRINNEEQFERLPAVAKEACRAHPSFQVRHFLHDVAKGRQIKAEALLTENPANTQTLLRTPGIFIDYSGRAFNCTAYEYAYWAKDTHMCRMLEAHMDEETKAQMLARIEAIEAGGLAYQQNGEAHQSAHFDLTALKTTLQAFIDGYDAWHAASRWAAMEAAWMEVGRAQRDVPVHVAQEYCRPDRSFDSKPEFNEATLPRVLTFYNSATGGNDSWFPLSSSNSGLGFNFALLRSGRGIWRGPRRADLGDCRSVGRDLAAITCLDKIRTADLTRSREHLNPPAISHGLSM